MFDTEQTTTGFRTTCSEAIETPGTLLDPGYMPTLNEDLGLGTWYLVPGTWKKLSSRDKGDKAQTETPARNARHKRTRENNALALSLRACV